MRLASAWRSSTRVGLYAWETVLAQLNLLDSHDTARALWIVGGDEPALRLCVLFQMTMPGAPCIYYGDEIGMSSAGDPYCRAAFPWDDGQAWNHELAAFYRKAIALRHSHPALRGGAFRRVRVSDGAYAFLRETDEERALVVFNVARQPRRLRLEAMPFFAQPSEWAAAWGQGRYRADAGKMDVAVPARGAGADRAA